MYVLFEESGKFLGGRILSEADTSMQVELESGKRVKLKSAHALLRFDQPAPAELLGAASALSREIDLDLAWEFAPEEEFTFFDLAKDYFSAQANLVQQTAALLRLFEAPHYFRRSGKGLFRKAPEETVKAALLGLERKRQAALQVDQWAQDLADGRCPGPVREQLYRILFKPDKNSLEYKAVVQAAKASGRSALDLLKSAGAIESPYQFHWRRFLFDQFPRGTGFPASLPPPKIDEELPLAPVAAFSIDDSATTEIDDALSVQGLGTGTVVFGIHIAAPGLALTPDSALDKLARERLSTVYMPGWKITMLPDEVVQAYTLTEGRDCPAVSLYVTFDEATLEQKDSHTRLERVPIVSNLRHDQLDSQVTEDSLTGVAQAHYPHAADLAFAFRLAQHLKSRREAVRGKPETFNRPDFTFRLESSPGSAVSKAEPLGVERVHIVPRKRGEPLDLIVAEAMILANSTWGAWLAQSGVPGIYRSQASLLPGVKVRMGTKPLPHAGMGVSQYAWSTSPLRRYVDLVNQWQIISCVRHGRMAALAAPFKPKDATLFAIISNFDAAYTSYNDFQRGIERYWTLRWLEQQGVQELVGVVIKPGWVRADELPLVLAATGTDALPRGTRVKVRLTGMDLMTLDAFAALVTPLDTAPTSGESEADLSDLAADDSDSAAGPIALAIDLSDGADGPAGAPAVTATAAPASSTATPDPGDP